MFAIRNKYNHKWLYGTDWNKRPAKQRVSSNMVEIFATRSEASNEFKRRECNNSYEIVEVEVIVKH